MIIIFAKFIEQLIDYPINCASLSKKANIYVSYLFISNNFIFLTHITHMLNMRNGCYA